MKPYKFSKVWNFVVNKTDNNLIAKAVKYSAFVMVIGLIIYYTTGFVWLVVFPFGFPTMAFVFFKTAVIIWEQVKMKRYCKKNKITIDEFNQLYASVMKANS